VVVVILRAFRAAARSVLEFHSPTKRRLVDAIGLGDHDGRELHADVGAPPHRDMETAKTALVNE
jgi:hypothetical protein